MDVLSGGGRLRSSLPILVIIGLAITALPVARSSATLSPTSSIPIGGYKIVEIAVDPVADILLVVDGYASINSCSSGNSASLLGISLPSGKVLYNTTLVSASTPCGNLAITYDLTSVSNIAVDPTKGVAYVGTTDWYSSAPSWNVSAIDDSTGSVIASIPVDAGQYIAVDPTTHLVFAGGLSNTQSDVDEISGATNTVTARLNVTQVAAAGVTDLTVNPAMHLVYGFSESNVGFFALNESPLSLAHNSTGLGCVYLGCSAVALAIDPGLNLLYLDDPGAPALSVASLASYQVIGSGPSASDYISVNTNTNLVFLASQGQNTVEVDIPSADNLANVTNIVMPANANTTLFGSAIAVDSSRNLLYVDTGTSVQVIDTSTITAATSSTISTSTPPTTTTSPTTTTASSASTTSGPPLQTIILGNEEFPQSPLYYPPTGDIYVVVPLKDHVIVISTSSNTVVATISVGTFPDGLTYDPLNHLIYVWCTDEDYIIDPSTNTVKGTFGAGSLFFDPSSGDLLRVNVGGTGVMYSGSTIPNVLGVSLIDPNTYQTLATLSFNQQSWAGGGGLTYDPSNNEVYISVWRFNIAGGGSLQQGGLEDGLVVRLKTNPLQIMGNSTTGICPTEVSYDQANHGVYVDNYGCWNFLAGTSSPSNTVTFVSSSYQTKTITLGSSPAHLLVDSNTGDVYVTSMGSSLSLSSATFAGVVSVIDPTTNDVLATVPVGNFLPTDGAIAYADSNGGIYVQGETSTCTPACVYGGVDAINTTTNAVVQGFQLGGPFITGAYLLYAPSDQSIYVFGAAASATTPAVSAVYIIPAPAVLPPTPSAQDQLVGTLGVGSDPVTSLDILDLTWQAAGCSQVASSGGYTTGGCTFVANFGSDTISVISDLTNQVIATVPVGGGPAALSFDIGSHELYVANSADNTVSVVGITDNGPGVISTIPVGPYPHSLVSVSAGTSPGETLVLCTGQIDVIDDQSHQVVATFDSTNGLRTGPHKMMLDKFDGNVYVTNQGNDSISRIQTGLPSTTNALTTISLPAGSVPNGISDVHFKEGKNSVADQIWIDDSGTNSISVICPLDNWPTATLLVCPPKSGVQTIPIGGTPGTIWGDYISSRLPPALVTVMTVGTLFVFTNFDANTLTSAGTSSTPPLAIQFGVESPAGNQSSAPSPPPQDRFNVLVDQANNGTYLIDSTQGYVYLLDQTSHQPIQKISVGSTPVSISYDNSTGNIYVVNEGSNTVSVIAGETTPIPPQVVTTTTTSSPQLPGVLDLAVAGAVVAVVLAAAGFLFLRRKRGPR